MLPGSIALMLLALATGAIVTVLFMQDVFPKITHPVTEFAPNQPHTFTPEFSAYPLALAASVSDSSSPKPEATVTIHAQGEPVELRESNRWQSMMGHSFRYFANFGPVEGEIELLVESDPSERFFVFYHPDSVREAGTAKAMPGWVVSAVLFFLGTIALLWTLATGSPKSDAP